MTEVNGNAVNNLTDNNFSVFENDIAVNSFSVSNAALPASVTLIFDYSESFSAALQSALDGGKIFIGNLNLNPSSPDSDEGSVIKFSTNIVNETLSVGGTLFSSNETILLNSIDAAGPAAGLSRFYDTVYQAITEISTTKNLKRAIITYSDGKDAGSTYKLNDVIAFAQQENVPVFTIGIGSVDESVLVPLSTQTGGQYFYLPDDADLEAIYQQISELLAGQYVISYMSAPNGGSTNTAKVSVDYNGLYGEDSKSFSGCP